MAVNVGINGFGRIGRLAFRAMMERPDRFNIVGINDLSDADILAYLLKYDSVHGRFPGKVVAKQNGFLVNGKEVPISAEKDPAKLNWGGKGAQVVLESTGVFTARAKEGKGGYDSHLLAGAKKVILSAPAKDAVDATIVMGVNDETLKPEHKCVSNASCTTNSLAPVMKVLDERFGIQRAMMTTIHAYTGDQQLVDTIHKSKTRACAAAINTVPTTTGAAKAIGQVLPSLKGKMDGIAFRVPVPTGSLTDVTAVVDKNTSIEEINESIKAAAEGPMKGIIEYVTDPLVSSDVIHNPHSSIFDSNNTMVIGNMIKVTMWYDNEWGYSCRTADLIEAVAKI